VRAPKTIILNEAHFGICFVSRLPAFNEYTIVRKANISNFFCSKWTWIATYFWYLL